MVFRPYFSFNGNLAPHHANTSIPPHQTFKSSSSITPFCGESVQKIRLQIMLTMEDLNTLHAYQREQHCKNESAAISQVFIHHSRLQFIVNKLELKAHEAEKWKLKAEKKVGTTTKPITAKGAKKNTGLKAKLGKNTLDIQQQDEGA